MKNFRYLLLSIAAAAPACYSATEGKAVVASGPDEYVKYLERQSDVDGLRYSVNQMNSHAKDKGEIVFVNVKSQEQQYLVNVGVKPVAVEQPGKIWLNVNNFGNRYSAGDYLATMGFAKHFGDGYQLSGSSTRGLPEFSSDSEDGEYYSFNLSGSKTTEYGKSSLAGMITNSQNGGEIKVLGSKSDIKTLSAKHEFDVNSHTSVFGELRYVENKSQFSTIGWSDQQNYLMASIGSQLQAEGFTATGSFNQGIVGNRDANMELLGSYNEGFSFITADLEYSKPFELLQYTPTFRMFAGGQSQIGSGTPSNERFSIGGIQRGRSQRFGAATAENGFYIGAELDSPFVLLAPGLIVQAYTGLDAGRAWDSNAMLWLSDENTDTNAAFLGARGSYKNALNFDVGYARDINSDKPENTGKLNFTVSAIF